MKKLITRFQNELVHLQESLQKESSDILAKLKKLDLKENIESKKKDLEKIIERKYQTFLPTCNRFAHELRAIAEKAGINVDKWEKSMLHTTGVVKKKIAKNKAKIVQGKERISKKIKSMAVAAPGRKVTKKKASSKKINKKAPSTPRARNAKESRVTAHNEG
jgi:hypothetical protein